MRMLMHLRLRHQSPMWQQQQLTRMPAKMPTVVLQVCCA
jgi:hypothetical protein